MIITEHFLNVVSVIVDVWQRDAQGLLKERIAGILQIVTLISIATPNHKHAKYQKYLINLANHLINVKWD